MKITFTDTLGVLEEFAPKPADKFIPPWYKDMDSYISKNKGTIIGTSNGTIKKCMPVFDAISSGYIITSYVDVYIRQDEKNETMYNGPIDISGINSQPGYESPHYEPIGFHPIEQALNHPYRGNHVISYPKWVNPWGIKTPPGYSTLVIQPMHRDSIFTILPGIVDTDKYNAPINFPFTFNEADKFEGLIPAGTPIAQVIPFKRDSWEMEIGKDKDVKESLLHLLKINIKIFDEYKNSFRQKKEYK